MSKLRSVAYLSKDVLFCDEPRSPLAVWGSKPLQLIKDTQSDEELISGVLQVSSSVFLVINLFGAQTKYT